MITTITITVIVAIGSIIIWILYRKAEKLQEQLKQSQSQLRSAFVKHGQVVENILPCSKDFPEGKFICMGQPVDGVIFNDSGVTFIEIKTGASKLSPKQKIIKQQVEDGKVFFKELKY